MERTRLRIQQRTRETVDQMWVLGRKKYIAEPRQHLALQCFQNHAYDKIQHNLGFIQHSPTHPVVRRDDDFNLHDRAFRVGF